LYLKLSKANRIFTYLSSPVIFVAHTFEYTPMQEQAKQAFEKLNGLPITKTTRNEHVQYFHFGTTHYTTPQGLVLDVGILVLAVDCPWQLYVMDGDIIKSEEVFLRKRETGLPSGKFDWKEPGASLRDQRLKEFLNNSNCLTVKQSELLNENGLLLLFTDGSRLVITPDKTKDQQVLWQLFSNTDDHFSLTASSSGIN
jgi:hypothetical protein